MMPGESKFKIIGMSFGSDIYAEVVKETQGYYHVRNPLVTTTDLYTGVIMVRWHALAKHDPTIGDFGFALDRKHVVTVYEMSDLCERWYTASVAKNRLLDTVYDNSVLALIQDAESFVKKHGSNERAEFEDSQFDLSSIINHSGKLN